MMIGFNMNQFIGDKNMEQAIQDIRDWAEKYGNAVCLNRLLAIMEDQMESAEVIALANELWEYDH